MMDDIVIKSFNGIGDLLFVTPTLRRIKEAYPKAHITVNTNYPDLVMDNPYVDGCTTNNTGLFLGYPDPIHQKWPTKHHIISDWNIVCNHYGLETERPMLLPEIYSPKVSRGNGIGVQVIHKGHWHQKKLWPNFTELSAMDGFFPIPRTANILDLVVTIAHYKAVVCAEGGISHIAKAVGTPAIVIYGGFAKPAWNGYDDQINICNEKWCSFCYNPKPCENDIERLCLKEITMEQVLHAVEGLSKIAALGKHNAKAFVEEDALRWCKGKGVDIGGGHWPLPGARVIDANISEDAYTVEEETGSLDYLFSSHCLEHLDYPDLALTEWVRILKHRGILYLYLPHPDYIPWRVKSMPMWHKHEFFVHQVIEMLEDVDIIEIVQKDYSFGQKIIARRR